MRLACPRMCAALMLLGRGAASFCKLQTVGGLLTFGYYGVSAIEQRVRKHTAVGLARMVRRISG